ncbi:conserved hypothetical protein [Candidatus Protochlamydia naegleriophila]|uniref:HAD-IB family hydrolase n=1 Tax=Candidatus Protochlamydia naegleriophila TaxID=389348 RepID=A0A0U5JES7_9BACT|nr:HAD family phosphatase [Candidatus Protochlamydia naegleriophila]CUI16262.1 conserved hypothetical protein [Candidatus Protochlamydia naegleriophila]
MRLSVFDLDHTLLTVNSSYHFGAYLYRQNFFAFPSLLASLFYYARHKLFGLSIQKLHQKTFQLLFKGVSAEELQTYASIFFEQHLMGKFYQPALQRLREAQKNGDYTLILSSSPDFLVKPIAEWLGVDAWQATIYAVDCGRMSLLESILDGQDKANYLVKLAQEMGVSSSSITVYSDSYLDLPILKMAGRAIGVVPDFYLKRICHEKGWEII